MFLLAKRPRKVDNVFNIFPYEESYNFAVRLHKLPFACCVFIRLNVRYILTTNYKRNNHIQRIPKRRSHSGKVTCLTVKWSKNLLCKPFSDISLTRRHSVTVREKRKTASLHLAKLWLTIKIWIKFQFLKIKMNIEMTRQQNILILF